jgi:hypothetical protein
MACRHEINHELWCWINIYFFAEGDWMFSVSSPPAMQGTSGQVETENVKKSK